MTTNIFQFFKFIHFGDSFFFQIYLLFSMFDRIHYANAFWKRSDIDYK
jgi:hypothetical protein